ncbi:MAG: phage virion morphogenesis protein [Pseudomonadota bacterium]
MPRFERFDLDARETTEAINTAIVQRRLGPLLRRTGRYLVRDAQVNIRLGRDVRGAPLAPIRRDGQILRDTSRLYRSIAYRLGQNEVRVGTNVEYARAQNYGFQGNVTVGRHTRRITQAFGRPLRFPVFQTVEPYERYMNLPAREYLGIEDRQVKRINELIDDWAEEIFEAR